MTFAYLAAMKSKDASSKIGAVIVGHDREIRSLGYNGIPRGVHDLEPARSDAVTDEMRGLHLYPDRNERPEKY